MCIDKYEFLSIGGKERRVDACIVPIVRALNDGGIVTDASCCGHFNRWGTIMLKDGRELLIIPDWDSGRAFDKIHGRPIHDERRALNTKVAAPLPGVGANAPSLTPTASAPDCLVGEPAVVPTTANKPQTEIVWPACDNSLCKYWKHGKVNCTLDKCPW